MLTKKFKLMMALLAVLTVGMVGCSKDDDKNPMNSGSPEPTLDIVETAAAAGNFTTLLAAAEAADLVDALKGAGPITVFAPTDEAFAKLPAGTVEALLANKDALTAILTYHVVPGAVTAAEVVKLTSVATLNGTDLTITVVDGKVMIDNAMVTVTDIKATNGIIHVIDAVLIPAASGSARIEPLSATASLGSGWVARAIRNGELNWLTKYLSLYTVSRLAGLPTLTTAVQAAGLQSTLMYNGPFTLFGPTEQAFAALPAGTVEALLKDPTTLSNILLYHVTPGVVKAADVIKLTEATMANGSKVSISVVNGGVKINNANVLFVNIAARNGVLHIIDGVLLP